ncbi:MAG: Gfo/Idh/MocA family oxidoreductase [Desulfobacteraceae bacterium]|nr:Gfo/Idh/MocA family oxidoreductase [Desulfobacteraceae bacterium]MBC2756749.1 Gfo/Idh/MocA family oxidoreductase [Desulfobacteraceae bacterium]
MINVAVIGCGYWGPNLIRNFILCPKTDVRWVCDKDDKTLHSVVKPYPSIKTSVNLENILDDKKVDGVAIATPVGTHFDIAKACLENGKHILIEKPMASSVEDAMELIALANKKSLNIMTDHTYCYTGTVRKIKEIMDSGEMGSALYYDSVRVNLGLFQHDVNVVWDLAPHDLSILDYLFEEQPVMVSTHGVCHAGNDIENIAYVSIRYNNNFIAHLHLNWLSPVKIRKTIIGGDEKMIVWNDLDADEKIKIYNKGIIIKNGEQEIKRKLLVSYRSGDMHAPRFESSEALSLVALEFAESIIENRKPLTDGYAGLRVVKILEAAEKSIKADGANVRI